MGALKTIPSFQLENIIGIPALDIPVHHYQDIAARHFSRLVFDPGQMVGWAGTVDDETIYTGQGEWHTFDEWTADEVWIEATPYAARLTFDPWPIRFDGMVRMMLYPRTPKDVFPTNLHVAKEWFKLPRGHGLGRHSKDALTHLVSVLVRESA